MDEERFDGLTRTLAGGVSRRAVLRGLAGGVAAALGGRAAAARAGQQKRPLCHATGDPVRPYTVVEVAEPAWETHLAHGDAPYVDCCPGDPCPGHGETCGGGGVPGACGCTPDNVAACQGQTCGSAVNNCGQTVSCGTCSAPLTCGGGGVANVCGCTRDDPTMTCAGRCGTVVDNCNQAVECAPCCTSTTCAAEGAECGSIADGCGGTLECGTCAAPEACGGGGVANVCGCAPEPRRTTCGTRRCGTAVNNCGQTVSCGTCQEADTCVDGQCLCGGQPCSQCGGWCDRSVTGEYQCFGGHGTRGERCTTDTGCSLSQHDIEFGFDTAICAAEGSFPSMYGYPICVNGRDWTCPST